MKIVQRIIRGQVAICLAIDRTLFGAFSVDGNKSFVPVADGLVANGSNVADVGGGKTPFFSPAQVLSRELSVTGVDLDEGELSRAPSGSYRKCIVSPIEQCKGDSDHDVVIAQSVLEHVRDGKMAAQGIASLLRPGGVVVTFCPCRRAWFARLNMLLPETVKRFLLFSIFPGKRERQGFPAFYNGCTPDEMVRNMANAGIELRELQFFFISSYFMFFAPLYLVWRLATFPFMKLWPRRYCETFIFVGVRKSEQPRAS